MSQGLVFFHNVPIFYRMIHSVIPGRMLENVRVILPGWVKTVRNHVDFVLISLHLQVKYSMSANIVKSQKIFNLKLVVHRHVFVTSQHNPRCNFVLVNNHAAIFSWIISRFFTFSQIAAVTNTPKTHQSVRNGHQKESASRILCSWSQNVEHPVLNVVPKTVCWFLFTHSQCFLCIIPI